MKKLLCSQNRPGDVPDEPALARQCRADAPPVVRQGSDCWAATVTGDPGTCRCCAGICQSGTGTVKRFTGICPASPDAGEPGNHTSGSFPVTRRTFAGTRQPSAGIREAFHHTCEVFDHAREPFDHTSGVADHTGEPFDRTGEAFAHHDFWPKTAKNRENCEFSLSTQQNTSLQTHKPKNV